MYSSTCIAFIINVFAHLLIECACTPRYTKFDLHVGQCLNRIALFYKIEFEGDINYKNYEDYNTQINSLQCAKNAIKYLVYPSEFTSTECSYYNELLNNLMPGKIKGKSEFCGLKHCKKPSCQCFNVNQILLESYECYEDLEDFPDDPKEAVKYALKDIIFIKGFGDETRYMIHIIDNVEVSDSLVQPLQYCKNIFSGLEEKPKERSLD